MATENKDESKEELIPCEQCLFTHSDFDSKVCSDGCPFMPALVKLQVKNSDLQFKQMEHEIWKNEMATKWNAICDQNAKWCQEVLDFEKQQVDMESKVAELKNLLDDALNDAEEEQIDKAELQRKHDCAVLALKELVTGIFLLTRGAKNTSLNEHVKPVKELTGHVFVEFIENYFQTDVDMHK